MTFVDLSIDKVDLSRVSAFDLLHEIQRRYRTGTVNVCNPLGSESEVSEDYRYCPVTLASCWGYQHG